MVIKRDILFGILTGLIGLLLLYVVGSVFCGCASQSPAREDSTHYVAHQPQDYPCPRCSFPIPTERISANIRIKNECPNCGYDFFYTPQMESHESQGQGAEYQGPKVFGRGYHRDIKYNNKVEHSVKNSWKVSPDGSSGSMSQTFIRSYEHTVDGEYGTLVGPGAHYGY